MIHLTIASFRCLLHQTSARKLCGTSRVGDTIQIVTYLTRRIFCTSYNMSSSSPEIKLTQRESQLRGLLLDVARYIDESKEIKEHLELRFAGGWVRDKLLGIPSSDIDAAINVMTGSSFTSEMKTFLSDPRNMAKHGLAVKDVGDLHKIAANPEKSKHLETVTTKLLGFDVDFVNLRKETYSNHSRNPQMEFGTALEDAERRDATINALFYNLHTNKVEDYTGGLDDMQLRIMRTPLDPYQTFKDDPLRILRLIRFASRLGFGIHAESEACMGDARILSSLRQKISRERVGNEVEKMLKGNLHNMEVARSYGTFFNKLLGPNPLSALQFIDRLGLYSTIFTDPTMENFPDPPTDQWKSAYDCLDTLKLNESPGSIYQVLIRTDEAAELSWILAALCPWACVPTATPNNPRGKSPLPFATAVAREGIKTSSRIYNAVTAAFRHRPEISSFKRAVVNKELWTYERDKLGMAIRRWNATGGYWKAQIVLAILAEAMTSPISIGEFSSNRASVNTLTSAVSGFDNLFLEWQQFLDHLIDMDVLDAPSQKRLIDGTQLATALGVKPGKWMTDALDVCMAWQFRHPGAIDPAGAVEEVRRRADDLKIPLQRS